ncbi:hypothetical protein [Azonexus hydrophilus]|uniref:Uncharacterized protein n=1 Tax=Azonexus hydrophilus TaxID=418702 RepID=A0ABZ2XP68_9RHOO
MGAIETDQMEAGVTFKQEEQQATMAVYTDERAKNELGAWQGGILDLAASMLTDGEQEKIQAQADVWQHAKAIPFPKRDAIKILPNGCLVFDVGVGQHHVHFCVWITAGECRIGAKVATALIGSEMMRRRVSEAYDGKPCQREVPVGQMIMFDWIFREGFAGFDTMTKAMRDPLLGAVVARRIGEILTHLYVNILSTIIEHNQMAITITPGSRGVRRIKKLVCVSGDRPGFMAYTASRGIRIRSEFPLESNSMIHVSVETDEGGNGLRCGIFHGENGEPFNIRSIT